MIMMVTIKEGFSQHLQSTYYATATLLSFNYLLFPSLIFPATIGDGYQFEPRFAQEETGPRQAKASQLGSHRARIQMQPPFLTAKENDNDHDNETSAIAGAEVSWSPAMGQVLHPAESF